jgi:RHS repeat-associated protein
MIAGGQGTAAIYTRRTSGTPLTDTYYVHSDQLGSPELITSSTGGVVVRLSFGAYGERRDQDWDGPVSAPDLTALANVSRHGFTGHEHLDAVGLIHMNGRVYEPVAGRFLGVDPLIDGVSSSQGPNAYAYVHNNPLTYIDLSGYGPCTPDTPQNCAQGPDWPTFYWRYVRESFDWWQDLIAAEGGGVAAVAPRPPRTSSPTIGGGSDRSTSYFGEPGVMYGVDATNRDERRGAFGDLIQIDEIIKLLATLYPNRGDGLHHSYAFNYPLCHASEAICDEQRAVDIVLRHPVPPPGVEIRPGVWEVRAGISAKDSFPVGNVDVVTWRALGAHVNLTWDNSPLEPGGHWLQQGAVFRHIFWRGDQLVLRTVGVGNNLTPEIAAFNQWFGRRIFYVHSMLIEIEFRRGGP